MTGGDWDVLYQIVVAGKAQRVGGRMVRRMEAATVLVLYDHPEVTMVQRRNLSELSFGEILDFAREWLFDRGAVVEVDPDGFGQIELVAS